MAVRTGVGELLGLGWLLTNCGFKAIRDVARNARWLAILRKCQNFFFVDEVLKHVYILNAVVSVWMQSTFFVMFKS